MFEFSYFFVPSLLFNPRNQRFASFPRGEERRKRGEEGGRRYLSSKNFKVRK